MKAEKFMTLHGHNIVVTQLDNDNVRRCICAFDHTQGVAYLISYYTCVAAYDVASATLYRTWAGWSRTTCRHVALFSKFLREHVAAKITYFDWKTAEVCVNEEFQPIFSDIVSEARDEIPCNDKYVKWGW